jgi:pantoate--beta-alanine ligase
VTAPAAVLPIAQALVLEIGGEPVVLAEESRATYHAALAHGANHLVTLTAQAQRVLAALGVDEPGRVLAPLLNAALDGALRGGEAGLTGPVVRGDVGTVAEHVRALGLLAARDESLVDVPPAYAALARATVQRSLVLGRLGPAQAQAVLDVLEPVARGGPAPAPSGPRPPVARTREELAAGLARLGGRRAVVMTMGALHEGHLELVRRARALADHVVVTIFVNPLQFGAGEDLDRYPRRLEADLAALAPLGVGLVFAPTPDVVYPDGDPVVRVSAGALGGVWEGASRPGHFDGVLTVVAKLLNLVRPDVAMFGQKDAQQLAAIRRMVRDLDMGVEIVAVPIQRDADGLARSSRNAYLTAGERRSALALSRALRAAQPAADASPDDAAPAALAAAREVLAQAERDEPGAVVVDYVTLVHPDTLVPVEADYRGTALLALAARVGRTRLIDNTLVHLGGDGAGARPSGGA